MMKAQINHRKRDLIATLGKGTEKLTWKLSDYEPNYGDGEMNDENLEEVLFDCAKHAKRNTVSLKDIQLARCIKYRREAC